MKGRGLLAVTALVALCACDRLKRDDPNEFVGTGCVEDPAVGVIEVVFRNLEMRSWAGAFPETTDTLDIDAMLAALQDGLDGQGCVEGDSPLLTLLPDSAEVEACGDLDLMFADGPGPYAGGVFDTRSGEMFFSWEGADDEWSRRCTPVGLGAAGPEYMRAAEPSRRYTYIARGAIGGEYALAEELNTCGVTWAGESGETWEMRTYDEIEVLMRRTEVANAFSACGDYELIAVAMGCGPDSTAGDIYDLKLTFVLVGFADGKVL